MRVWKIDRKVKWEMKIFHFCTRKEKKTTSIQNGMLWKIKEEGYFHLICIRKRMSGMKNSLVSEWRLLWLKFIAPTAMLLLVFAAALLKCITFKDKLRRASGTTDQSKWEENREKWKREDALNHSLGHSLLKFHYQSWKLHVWEVCQKELTCSLLPRWNSVVSRHHNCRNEKKEICHFMKCQPRSGLESVKMKLCWGENWENHWEHT